MDDPNFFPSGSPSSAAGGCRGAQASPEDTGGLLPAETRAWVLSDGKVGDDVQCLGLVEALGLAPERRVVAPRRMFAWAMPWGPIDPREAQHRKGSPLAGSLPDLIVAAGRRCVPYLRHLKRASGGSVFAVFVKDPYSRDHGADVIWVPEHDRRRGDEVIVSLTPANRLSARMLEAARRDPDPRLSALPRPRVALLLGGASKHHQFGGREENELAAIVLALARQGAGVMVTPSRRTPARIVASIETALARELSARQRTFVWRGDGANPYVGMIALADSIIVTGDSVNMIGKSLTSGAPVHVYEPSGGHRKITAYVEELIARGLVRRWRGALEEWTYAPVNATPMIAAEIARRYLAFRAAGR